MQKTTTKIKLLTALLTLCVALSMVSISAYADGVTYISKVSVAYGNINYKAGETPRATASVAEGNCTVAYEYWRELYQAQEGGVWSGTGRYWYSDAEKMASLSEDQRITQFEAGHHYSYNIVLVTDNGYFFSDDETVVSVGEYDWYTPGSNTNLEIKEMSTELRIYGIYSVDLPDDTISTATIENVKFNYQVDDAPQATATVAAADADKYEIAYECWQQFENNNPVAAWYSDNGSHGSLPAITEFGNGKTYVYSIMLQPKDGYSFSSTTDVTVNGEDAGALFSNGSLYIPSVKTITPTKQTSTITTANIENVKFDYQVGDAPQPTARRAAGDYKYDIAYECWQQYEDNNLVAAWYSDNNLYGSLPDITAFEDGKTYVYSIALKPKDGYSFSSETVVTVKGIKINAFVIGSMCYINSVKTITPTQESGTITGGDSAGDSGNANLGAQAGDAPQAPQASGTTPEYKIIEGANGVWMQNSDGTLKVVANGDFSKFTGIRVDGELVAADMYTAVSGSTVITLKKDYLDTLSVGRHTLNVVYSDGECSTEIEIETVQSADNASPDESDQGNMESPKTGDSSNLMVWVALLIISGGAFIGTTVVSKKKKYNS